MIFKTYTFIAVCFLFVNVNLSAQEWQLQLVGGVMNYGGDLQAKGYTFTQAHPTAGLNLLFRVKKFALRAGGAFGQISGQDGVTTDLPERNLNFKSNIAEGNGVLEYHLLSDDKDYKIIPYVFIGGAVFHYNPYTNFDSQKVYLQPLGTEGEGLSIYPFRKMYQLTDLAIIYGLGFRYKISSSFMIGFEYNARFLRTDYLDDVSKKYPDETALYEARGQLAVDLSYRGNATQFPQNKPRGNPNQNDNYYSSVISLTYIFHQSNSFNNGTGSNKKSLRALLCPKKVH